MLPKKCHIFIKISNNEQIFTKKKLKKNQKTNIINCSKIFISVSDSSRYVRKNDHYRLSRKDLQRYRMENRMGIRSRKFTLQFANCSPKLFIHVLDADPRSCGDWFRGGICQAGSTGLLFSQSRKRIVTEARLHGKILNSNRYVTDDTGRRIFHGCQLEGIGEICTSGRRNWWVQGL